MEKISCGIIRDLLPLYLDDVCSEESREAVEKHLQHCPACKKELEAMKGKVTVCAKREAEKMTQFQDFIKGQKQDSWKKGLGAGLISAGILVLAAFYLLPLLIVDTGSGMFILLLAVPILCLLAGVIFGALAGVKWYFPLVIGILFLPTVYLYFNSTALVYIPVYAVIGCIGELFGWGVRHLTSRKK